MDADGGVESLADLLRQRASLQQQCDEVWELHTVTQERMVTLSREQQQCQRQIDAMNVKYIALKAARERVEYQIVARNDGMQSLMPGLLGEVPTSAVAPLTHDQAVATGSDAAAIRHPADIYTELLAPYRPPHGRSGQRLKSSRMVRDVMQALGATTVSRKEFTDAFFDRFPPAALQNHWENPGAAVTAAFDRAVHTGIVTKTGDDEYTYTGTPATAPSTDGEIAMSA